MGGMLCQTQRERLVPHSAQRTETEKPICVCVRHHPSERRDVTAYLRAPENERLTEGWHKR